MLRDTYIAQFYHQINGWMNIPRPECWGDSLEEMLDHLFSHDSHRQRVLVERLSGAGGTSVVWEGSMNPARKEA